MECSTCLWSWREPLYLEQVTFCDALPATSALTRTTDTWRGVGRRGHSWWRGGGSSPLHRHCSTSTRSLLVPRALVCNKQASSVENSCYSWSNLPLYFRQPFSWRPNAKLISERIPVFWDMRPSRFVYSNQRLGGTLLAPSQGIPGRIPLFGLRWRERSALKRWHLHANRQGVIPQKTGIFISTTVRTWNLTYLQTYSCR